MQLALTVILVFIATSCVIVEKPLMKRKATEDLRLKHAQLEQALEGWEFHVGGFGNPREDKLREKRHIEQELFRRYKAGESNAFLPIFSH